MIQKLKQAEVDEIARPMVLDLTAVFSLIEDDVNELIKTAIACDWTEDRLAYEIEKLFNVY